MEVKHETKIDLYTYRYTYPSGLPVCISGFKNKTNFAF